MMGLSIAAFSQMSTPSRHVHGSHFFTEFSPMVYTRLLFSSGSGRITRAGPYVILSATNTNISHGGGIRCGDDWIEKAKEGWRSTRTVDAAKYNSEKAKDGSDEADSNVQQLLDSHLYLINITFPLAGTLAGTYFAWFALPTFLRYYYLLFEVNSHLYPYPNSFWGALEDPIRYFFTFLTFLQVGPMVAPDIIKSQYAAQAWKGAVVASLVWFLHRWKTGVVAVALSAKSLVGVERHKFLAFDKVSSVALFIVGLMALAEVCGVAAKSVLTLGGIGGVATAWASKDILENVLGGLSIQITGPFSVGETIKAGSVEGQVVEMGFTTTSMLTAENFPIVVPNSLFTSQVIVNKSRAKLRSMVRKIPIRIDDVDKIPLLSEDIKSMLKSNSNVFLEKEAPYCFLSQIERSHAELTLGCNLKNMTMEAEQDILLQAIRIIKEHGAELGSTHDDSIK